MLSPPCMPVKHSRPEPCPQPSISKTVLLHKFRLPLHSWSSGFYSLAIRFRHVLPSSYPSRYHLIPTMLNLKTPEFKSLSFLLHPWIYLENISPLYNQCCIVNGHCFKLEALCHQGLCLIPLLSSQQSHIFDLWGPPPRSHFVSK